MDFLGFTVSAGGVAVNPERVKGLKEMREPRNVQELQSALGLLGFYARFVPAYATLVEPLRKMLRKGAPPFKWTAELQEVLDEVRQKILVSPVLAVYDLSLPTRVTTAVWAVEKWRKYLWGQEFCLRVDHAALKTLLKSTGVGRAGMRVARWAAKSLNRVYVDSLPSEQA